MQKSYLANTNIDIMDGTARAHAVNSILYNVAATYVVQLPMAAQRVRIIYNNCYDADGSTVAIKSGIVEVTAI